MSSAPSFPALVSPVRNTVHRAQLATGMLMEVYVFPRATQAETRNVSSAMTVYLCILITFYNDFEKVNNLIFSPLGFLSSEDVRVTQDGPIRSRNQSIGRAFLGGHCDPTNKTKPAFASSP